MKNIWKHFRTVTAHRNMVLRHCLRAGIPLRGLKHDLSKYSPAEFWVGVKFYQGNRSPNEGEREAYGYSKAWMHHKGRNRHHFEYWTDYNPKTKQMEPVEMPLDDVIEMFCDRMAASKIYLKKAYTDRAPLDYYLAGEMRRNIHPQTASLLHSLLFMLANDGEEAVFRHIRALRHQRAKKD